MNKDSSSHSFSPIKLATILGEFTQECPPEASLMTFVELLARYTENNLIRDVQRNMYLFVKHPAYKSIYCSDDPKENMKNRDCLQQTLFNHQGSVNYLTFMQKFRKFFKHLTKNSWLDIIRGKAISKNKQQKLKKIEEEILKNAKAYYKARINLLKIREKGRQTQLFAKMLTSLTELTRENAYAEKLSFWHAMYKEHLHCQRIAEESTWENLASGSHANHTAPKLKNFQISGLNQCNLFAGREQDMIGLSNMINDLWSDSRNFKGFKVEINLINCQELINYFLNKKLFKKITGIKKFNVNTEMLYSILESQKTKQEIYNLLSTIDFRDANRKQINLAIKKVIIKIMLSKVVYSNLSIPCNKRLRKELEKMITIFATDNVNYDSINCIISETQARENDDIPVNATIPGQSIPYKCMLKFDAETWFNYNTAPTSNDSGIYNLEKALRDAKKTMLEYNTSYELIQELSLSTSTNNHQQGNLKNYVWDSVEQSVEYRACQAKLAHKYNNLVNIKNCNEKSIANLEMTIQKSEKLLAETDNSIRKEMHNQTIETTKNNIALYRKLIANNEKSIEKLHTKGRELREQQYQKHMTAITANIREIEGIQTEIMECTQELENAGRNLMTSIAENMPHLKEYQGKKLHHHLLKTLYSKEIQGVCLPNETPKIMDHYRGSFFNINNPPSTNISNNNSRIVTQERDTSTQERDTSTQERDTSPSSKLAQQLIANGLCKSNESVCYQLLTVV